MPKFNSLFAQFESVTGGGPRQGSGAAVSELHADRPSLLHSLAVISTGQVLMTEHKAHRGTDLEFLILFTESVEGDKALLSC